MPISFYKVVFDEDYTLYTQIFAWYMLSKEWKRSYIQEQRMTTLLTWGAIGYLGAFFGFLGPCAGGPMSHRAMQPCPWSFFWCRLVAYDILWLHFRSHFGPVI
jgi:hypothetical protein